MGKSLQDQLLKIGMATDGQVKKAKAEKRKQQKQQQKNKVAEADSNKLSAQQAAAAKAERDRQLNRQKAIQAEQKAATAQVRQLIENNKQLQGDEEIAYKFVDAKKVKTIYVSDSIRQQLSKGKSVIVKLDQSYQVIPAETAEKIRARDEAVVILQNSSDLEIDGDDPYAHYQVPDDLMW